MFRWPELTAGSLLELVAAQELDNHDQRKIAVVFLATALELFIEDPIIFALPNLCDSRPEALAMHEDNEGRARRVKLYKRLVGKGVNEVLQSSNLDRFHNDWCDLARLRNAVVHGRFFTLHQASEAKEIALITRLYNDCLPAFSSLQNESLASTRTANISLWRKVKRKWIRHFRPEEAVVALALTMWVFWGSLGIIGEHCGMPL